jgi:hypothetical protein
MSIVGSAEDLAICTKIVTAYDGMLVTLECMRSEAVELDELLAIASVSDQITASRRHYAARLRKMQQAEDAAWQSHGVLPSTAAGCRAGSPAVKGHGCPALPVAGSAPRNPNRAGDAAPVQVDIIPPDNPLFCARSRKELPGLNNPVDTQLRATGASRD